MKLPGLPNRLRWARIRAGFTRQIDAAVALGMSQQNVSDLENGKRGLSIQRLMQIATVYGCTTDYLLGLTPKTGRMIAPVPGDGALTPDTVPASRAVELSAHRPAS